jgi:phosphotransferase system enzyme I (PtsI)
MIIATMRILKGIGASAGIGVGPAFLYRHEKLIIPHTYLPSSQKEREKTRFQHAIKSVETELKKMGNQTSSSDHKAILETYLLMLSDPDFISNVESQIEKNQVSAERAVDNVVSNLIATLESVKDVSIKERSADIFDVGQRIIRTLMGKRKADLTSIVGQVVLVAETLLPSEALLLDPEKVKAIALSGGGRTSHVAILARALQIPTVVGLGNLIVKVNPNDEIIVDGNSGEVVIRPSSSAATKMRERHQRWQEHQKSLLEVAKYDAVTKDGHSVLLKANIETVDEIDLSLKHNSSGIGLFRSEFLFLKPGGATEDEQFLAYKKVLESFKDEGSVTIRTIDVGGDKIIPQMEGLEEENPILGWRAVRFCLSRKDIFRTQLKALLRASIYGKLKIMFPMISGVEELENVLFVLEQVKEECRTNNIPFDEDVEVGIMVEVPSAALCSDLLAPKTDFFSIGTNDLIQYTIAVDRGNDKIAYLYQPFHVGVLRLIKNIIDEGKKNNIMVAMCGEMAGDPLSTVLLLGLGLDEFSMSPQSLLEVKNIIRSVTLKEAKKLADEVMRMSSYMNITTYIKEWMNEKFPDLTLV